MAQDKRIEAFRRRLWRRGYEQVTIVLGRGDYYHVSAVEPLAGLRVRSILRLEEMNQMMKRGAEE